MRTMVQSGQTLGGRYLVRERLGQGGWGSVFAALQTDLGRPVAVKVLHLDVAIERDGLARFEREARAAAALGHPNIAQVTDFQAAPGEPPFLVMELLSGETLGAAIAREGRLPAPRVAWIAHQILSALEAAHGAGIVHRDVKPDNVFLVSASGVQDLVKLLDFGIAKLAEQAEQAGDGRRGQEPMTADGAMMGSPAYMAPEQITGGAVDLRTDLYAVGATMYRALTGAYPFDAQTLHALLLAITQQPLRPVTSLEPRVDPAFAAIVERALGKDPSARFASASEMRAALEPWTHAVRRGPRAGTAAMAPIPMSMPIASATGGAVSSLAGTGTGAPGWGAPAQSAAPSAAASHGAPVPMPAPAPAPARAPAGGGLGALLVVLGMVALAGLAAVGWYARGRLTAPGEVPSTVASADAGPLSTALASGAPPRPESSGGPPNAPRSGPGIARPIPTVRLVDGGALVAPTAPADAGAAPQVAAVDAGSPRKAYGGRRAELGAGSYGGDADHDYVAPTRAAIARVQSLVDACFAATEYDPPEHVNPMWTIDVLSSGRAGAVRPSPGAGNQPKLDACMIPVLRGVTYPARPRAEEIRLGFKSYRP
jgi:serine/threonine-protein kinase